MLAIKLKCIVPSLKRGLILVYELLFYNWHINKAIGVWGKNNWHAAEWSQGLLLSTAEGITLLGLAYMFKFVAFVSWSGRVNFLSFCSRENSVRGRRARRVVHLCHVRRHEWPWWASILKIRRSLFSIGVCVASSEPTSKGTTQRIMENTLLIGANSLDNACS